MTHTVRFSAISLVVLLAGCQGPENLLLKKYFTALQFEDKATLSSIACEPVSMRVAKWEIVSVSEELEKTAELKPRSLAIEDATAKLEALQKQGRDTKDAFETADAALKSARGAAKAAAQADFDQKKADWEKMKQSIIDADKAVTAAKGALADERRIAVLSVSEIPGIENMEGTYRAKDVMVRLTIKGEDGSDSVKEYLMSLRNYRLKDSQTGRALGSKWIIVRMEPKS